MGPIAQSVEQRTFNPWVDGSSPSGPTNIENSRLTEREAKMSNLNKYRENIFTKAGARPCPGYGEDGVFQKIFSTIGTSKNPRCVEFGELRVLGTTSRAFRLNYIAKAYYFSGSLDFKSKILNIMDVVKVISKTLNFKYFKFFFDLPKKIFVTPDNLLKVIPKDFMNSEIDLFVVDIDSFDFEIVSLILGSGIRPRVFVVEYNPSLPIRGKFAWKYQMSTSVKTNLRMYGASYECWSELFADVNYKLVHISGFCNLIYIRGDLENDFSVPDIISEVTDTNEKVLEFANLHCLRGFKPSWISAPYLTLEEIEELSF